MSTEDMLLEEIKHQPEPVQRDLLRYLKFLIRQDSEQGPTDLTACREQEERKRLKEKVSKWDNIRREQLGVALTLLFGLASGGLAFCASLLTSERQPFTPTPVVASYFRTAFVLFAVTVGISIVATCTRLTDFRLTALKLRSELRGVCGCFIKFLSGTTKFLGRATWFLFYAQIVFFTLSVIYLSVFLWNAFHGRLFP